MKEDGIMKKVFFAFALLALASLVSCNKETVQDDPVNAAPAVSGTLVVSASKQDVTKALAFGDDGSLNAFWSSGETVSVYNYESGALLGTVAPTTYGEANTKLEGTIDISSLKVGTRLMLLFSGSGNLSYTKQDGLLSTIADKYDTAVAYVDVAKLEDGYATTDKALFENLQAIVKFKFRDAADKPIDVQTLYIRANIIGRMECTGSGFMIEEEGMINITPSSFTDELYVSICPKDHREGYYYLCALASDGKYYEKLVENALFGAGVYYEGTVTMQPVTYTVAGCSGPLGFMGDDRIFGSTWDPTLTSNDMTFDGMYFSRTYRAVPQGVIVYLKVAKNHSWGEFVAPGGDNIVRTAWAEADLEVKFDPVSKEAEAYFDFGGDIPDHPEVYTVAGTPERVFGVSWQIKTPENDLTLQDDGTYSITYTGVTPGEIRFRILEDRRWDWTIPDVSVDPYYVNVEKFGNLTIIYNPVTSEITTSFVETGIPADSKLYLVGTFSGWQFKDEFIMTRQDDGTYIYRLPFMTADANVEFKVVLNGSWDNSHWPAGPNYAVSVPGQGYLTVVFNPVTGEISTSFEEQVITQYFTIAGSSNNTEGGQPDILFGTAWDPTLTANDLEFDSTQGGYLKYYNITQPMSIAFKVVQDHSWEKNWPEENYTVEAFAPGTLLVGFDPVNHYVVHQMTYSGTSYVLTGDFSGWLFYVANILEKVDDDTYTKTVALSGAGIFGFKITVNGSWGGAYWPSGDNYMVDVDGPCTVTFTFHPSTGEISHVVS